MKKFATGIVLIVIFVACSSSQQQSSGPNITVHLEQVNTPSDVFYVAGPISVQYRVTVTNPTDQPATLKRLELQTVGRGAYDLRAQSPPLNLKVPANGAANVTVSVWGQSRGGYLAAEEPVTVRGTAYFEGANAPFVRIFIENISQFTNR